MSGVPERALGLKQLATPPMLWMYSMSMSYCHQFSRATSPTMTGVRFTMHFGSKPRSLVGTPSALEPWPIRVVSPAAGVKSGLTPVGSAKNATLPVITTLLDQPDGG